MSAINCLRFGNVEKIQLNIAQINVEIKDSNKPKGEVMENKAVVVIEKRTQDLTKQATSIVISTQDHYEKANEFLRAVKGLQKEIHSTFDPIVEAAHRTHKEATSKRKEHLDPVIGAEGIVKDKMIAYSDEQERLRQEEQRKIDAKARIEEEKKRKELEERAKKWAAKGNEVKAEALQEQAEEIEVVAPVIAPKVEKVAGVIYSKTYSVDTADINQVPREYLLINFPALNKRAQASKGMAKVTGVTFKCTKKLASRGY